MRAKTLIIAGFIMLTPVAFSYAAGLVPCSGPECQACHVVQLAQNIINFIIGLAVLIAVLLFAWAGMLMVTAAGGEGISKAKGMFTSAAIGFIIVLAAWLVVDTVMKMLTNQGALGPWNQIKCETLPTVPGTSTGMQPGGVAPGGAAGTAGCPGCVAIDPSVARCKHANSCTVDAAFAQNLGQLSGYGLYVTEGYPPTYTHQNACHQNGTCLDVTINNWSTSNIQQFQADAAAAGYRAVYEPPRGESCPSGTTCQPYSVTGSTGRHFSLYKN